MPKKNLPPANIELLANNSKAIIFVFIFYFLPKHRFPAISPGKNAFALPVLSD
jgi:hypothetical protein